MGSDARWRIGLMNHTDKFLTAESFGFKLNVSGTSLKKRQIWIFTPIFNEPGVFTIKSHLNRYLASDKDGRVTCEIEEETDECKFILDFSPHHCGGWSLKNVAYSYYLTGKSDQIDCFSKSPIYWRPHLAIHPQVHIKNLFRQRYIRVVADEVRGDQLLPWGHASLITLEHKSGLITIKTCDGRFLCKDGSLKEDTEADSRSDSSPNNKLNNNGSNGSENNLYHFEIRTVGQNTGIAFQDQDGKYLTLIGNTGQMRSKNKTVTKDELFLLEDSYVQLALIAHNGKYASIRQGMDIYANQMQIDESEIFQFEYQQTNEWKIRGNNGKLWTIDSGTLGVKASGSEADSKAIFQLFYPTKMTLGADGSPVNFIGIRCCMNGQLISCRKLGVISASGTITKFPDAESIACVEVDEEKWFLVLQNRPELMLRSEYGGIGVRHNRLEGNLAHAQAFKLEYVQNGNYILGIERLNLYLSVAITDGGLIQLSDRKPAQTFSIHFINRTQLALRANINCKYLRCEQNGTIKADSDDPNLANCLLEY